MSLNLRPNFMNSSMSVSDNEAESIQQHHLIIIAMHNGAIVGRRNVIARVLILNPAESLGR